jgi:hypothetical protein
MVQVRDGLTILTATTLVLFVAITFEAVSVASFVPQLPQPFGRNIVGKTTNKQSHSSVLFYNGGSPSADGETHDEMHRIYHWRTRSEFDDLEPLPVSETRKMREVLDLSNQARFVEHGDDLWKLRSVIDNLSIELIDAISSKCEKSEKAIRESLRNAEHRDAELVYKMELEASNIATEEGRDKDAERHHQEAMNARSCIPHFSLDGLWVGK